MIKNEELILEFIKKNNLQDNPQAEQESEMKYAEFLLSELKSKYMSSLTDALEMKKSKRDRILELLKYDSMTINKIKNLINNNQAKILLEEYIQLEFNAYNITQKLIHIINDIPNGDCDNLLTFYIKNVEVPGYDHKLLKAKNMGILYNFLIKFLEVNIKH